MVPESPAVTVTTLTLPLHLPVPLPLHLHLCLHPCNHLLHVMELSLLFQQDLVFIHVLIVYFPAPSLQPPRSEAFCSEGLGSLPVGPACG